MNWYVYANNSPVTYSDLLGLEAGDLFNSVEEVWFDAYWNYYGVTDFTKLEQGAIIYSFSNIDEETGTATIEYSYTTPVIGEPDSIDFTGMDNMVPEGAKIEHYLHTHSVFGAETEEYANTFSKIDYGFINKKIRGTMFYLLSGTGVIKELMSVEHLSPVSVRQEGVVVNILPGEKKLTYKKLNMVEKLIYALKYSKTIEDHLQANNCELHTSEMLDGLEITEIYNNVEEYTKRIVGL